MPLATSASTQDVRVTDLVARATHPGVRLLAPLDGVPDRLLYRAYRDIVVRRAAAASGEEAWHCDRVHYSAGRLPGGEPVRSIGHWNRPGQIEVFQVDSGRVVILCVLNDLPERAFVAEYGPGDVCVVPPSAYHLTYSPWQASVVTNIYQDASALPAEHQKYEGAAAPPFLLRWTRPRFVVVRPRTVGGHHRVVVDARQLCPPSLTIAASLPDLLRHGSDEELRALRRQVEAAYVAGWPQ